MHREEEERMTKRFCPSVTLLIFLKHAGELRIIILIEEKEKSYRG